MSKIEIPVTTLFLTPAIHKRFGNDLPRLVPVHISCATNPDTPHANIVMDHEEPIAMPTEAAYIEGTGFLMNGGYLDDMSPDAARFVGGLNGATSVIVSQPKGMDSLLVHIGHCVMSLRAVNRVKSFLGDHIAQAVYAFNFEGSDPKVTTDRDLGDCPVICRMDDTVIIAAGQECLATSNGHIVWAGLGARAQDKMNPSAARNHSFDEGWSGGSQITQVLTVCHAEVLPDGSLVHHVGWNNVKGSRFPALDRA